MPADISKTKHMQKNEKIYRRKEKDFKDAWPLFDKPARKPFLEGLRRSTTVGGLQREVFTRLVNAMSYLVERAEIKEDGFIEVVKEKKALKEYFLPVSFTYSSLDENERFAFRQVLSNYLLRNWERVSGLELRAIVNFISIVKDISFLSLLEELRGKPLPNDCEERLDNLIKEFSEVLFKAQLNLFEDER